MYNVKEIGKASEEVMRRRKVQENLTQLQQREKEFMEGTEEALRTRMRHYEENRGRNQEARLKEYRMIEENWKKRWTDIARKKRRESKLYQERAEQARKDTEEFWSKKHEAERERLRLIESRARVGQQEQGRSHSHFGRG